MRGWTLTLGSIVLTALALGAGSGCGSDDGGGGSSGAGGGGSGGAAGAGGGGLVSCASYCDAITTGCSGSAEQYGSKDTCLASCSAFPLGVAGDKTGDSLECRAYHASIVPKGLEHCAHAGPAGDGMCGSNCEGYCSLMMKHCAGAYSSASDCASACAGITGASSSGYDTGTKSGDSLFCRIYHATAASTDPTTHCTHAKLNPTSACL